MKVKEGPVRFVVMDLAADRDGRMEQDALDLMAAMAITVVWTPNSTLWSRKVQPRVGPSHVLGSC